MNTQLSLTLGRYTLSLTFSILPTGISFRLSWWKMKTSTFNPQNY